MYYIGPKPVYYEDYVTNVDEARAIDIIKKLANNELIALDTETTGMDYFLNNVLLASLSDGEDTIVLSRQYLHLLKHIDPETHTFITQNGKFDFGMLHIDCDYTMISVWDVMIADQKIYQGASYHPVKNPQGIRYRLTDIATRYLKRIPMFMDKEIRGSFVGVNPNSFVAEAEQVLYSGTDVGHLHEIRSKQVKEMTRLGLMPYMLYIGQYAPMSAGLMECEGWILNTEQWRQNIKDNQLRQVATAKKLDDLVKQLRDTTLTPDERKYLSHGKFDRNRVDSSVTQLGLFSETDKNVDATKRDSYTNWGSTDQICDLFARLKMPLPTKDKAKPVAIPQLIQVTNTKGDIRWKVDKDVKFTTKADELETFLLENPKTPGLPIIELLSEYRNAEHEISSFGMNFVHAINPVTGKLHTRFRTDTAETGRYQSGEKDTIYLNHQNIPRKEQFRTAFTVDTNKYSVGTIDLAGAEVTIMCDKAHDMQLYEWAVKNDDAHSPISQACWRNIFLYRAGHLAGYWTEARGFWRSCKNNGVMHGLATNEQWNVKLAYQAYTNFVVSKKENKEYRTQFKPITFGVIYGMGYKLCAKVLGISLEEAKIVIATLKSAIPDTFAYVEGCVEFAFNYGYLPLEDRTNSRVLFPQVIEVLKRGEQANETNLNWNVIHDIDGAARNYSIQGTQASMVKEALAEISLWNRKHRFDAAVINMVHDELNTRQPREYDGVNGDKTVLWLSDQAKQFLAPQQEVVQPVLTYEISAKTSAALVERGWAANVSYPEFVGHTMKEAANRYLKHFKMGAEVMVADTWIK